MLSSLVQRRSFFSFLFFFLFVSLLVALLKRYFFMYVMGEKGAGTKTETGGSRKRYTGEHGSSNWISRSCVYFGCFVLFCLSSLTWWRSVLPMLNSCLVLGARRVRQIARELLLCVSQQIRSFWKSWYLKKLAGRDGKTERRCSSLFSLGRRKIFK